MNLWLWMVAAGLITFTIRFSFIFLLERVSMPSWFQRALHYVPAAVLAAIILPEMVFEQGQFDLSWHNPQWLAGCAAVLIAFFTRSMLWTVSSGLVLYLLLHLL